jgi:hypothetical protein
MPANALRESAIWKAALRLWWQMAFAPVLTVAACQRDLA